jgi:hypothetical protein
MGHAGQAARVVDSFPGWELTPVETRYGGRRATEAYPLRFGRYPGVTAWDSVIATTANIGYVIDLRHPNGRVVRRISVPVPRRAVTGTMRNRLIAEELKRLDASGGAERMVDPGESRRLATAVPFADSLPSINSLHAADANTLWVVDPGALGDTSWSATAFRQDGAILGRLHVNGLDWPRTFIDDRVVVKHEDDDGVISFRVYRIVPKR